VTAMSISQARDQLFPLVKRVNADHTTIEIVAKDGNAVLMSAEDYASILETLYLYSTPANIAHLVRSFAQLDAGEVVSVDLDALLAKLDTE